MPPLAWNISAFSRTARKIRGRSASWIQTRNALSATTPAMMLPLAPQQRWAAGSSTHDASGTGVSGGLYPQRLKKVTMTCEARRRA